MSLEDIVLFKKEGFVFRKLGDHHYSLNFSMQNNNIILHKIINFDLVNLIYELNKDVYVSHNLEKQTENTATITFLIKHLFEDLGLPQRYSYINVVRKECPEKNQILFFNTSIKTERPPNIPETAQLLAMDLLTITCTSITQHQVLFNVDVKIDKEVNIPTVSEKIMGIIFYKIFNRLKEFIENVRI